MIVLTIAEISDLAKFAGLRIDPAQEIDRDDLETEIAIDLCPPDGVTDDDGSKIKCKHIAYYDERPEEGCCPLGTPIPPNTGDRPPPPQRPKSNASAPPS